MMFMKTHKYSVFYGGGYRITGTVAELGVLGRYRVCLMERLTNKCVNQVVSAADGVYVFDNIKYQANGYYVIAFDRGDNPLNAAIADLITPEPMP